jgi:hypothetical protein
MFYKFNLYFNWWKGKISIFKVSIFFCDSPALDNEFIPCLLYADDIVLLSESAEGLQHSLNALHHYCNKWDLRVNIDKTKVIIFNKSGRLLKNVHFKYYGNSIECGNGVRHSSYAEVPLLTLVIIQYHLHIINKVYIHYLEQVNHKPQYLMIVLSRLTPLL